MSIEAKRLTDEEIKRIWSDETEPERTTGEMVRAFARAIEYAYGIEEKTMALSDYKLCDKCAKGFKCVIVEL